MSNGRSKARAEAREDFLVADFFNCLLAYLESHQKEGPLKDLIEAGRKIDYLSRQYWDVDSTRSLIFLLTEKEDKKRWAKVLTLAKRMDAVPYRRLKAASPFSSGILVVIEYGKGAITSCERGELEELLGALIRAKTGWRIKDGDTYAILLSRPSVEAAEVVWLSCNAPRMKGPRSAD